MGTVLSRIKENRHLKNMKIKENIEKGGEELSRKKSSCFKMLRRDIRAEKIYSEIRQRDEEEFLYEI